MKFEDDISNLHTYIHTYMDKPKPICPDFFNVVGIKTYSLVKRPMTFLTSLSVGINEPDNVIDSQKDTFASRQKQLLYSLELQIY